jgi:hypothetical protein
MSTDKDSKTRTASEALAEVQAESESKKARQQEEKSDAEDSAKKAPSSADAVGFGLGDAVVTRSGLKSPGGLERALRFYVAGVCCETGTVNVHQAGSRLQVQFSAGDLVLLRDAEAQAQQKKKNDDADDNKSDDSDSASDDANDEDYEDDSEDEAAVAQDVAEEAAAAAVLQAEQEAKLTNDARLGDLVKCHPEAMQKVMLLQLPNKHCEDLDTAEAWMFSVKELKEVFGITLDQFYTASEEQLAKWMFKDDDDFPTDEGWTEHEEFMATHNTSTDFHIGQGDGEIMLALRTVTLNA